MHIHNLRALIDPNANGSAGSSLVTHPGAYELRTLPGDIDAEVAEGLICDARPNVERDPRLAIVQLSRALAMWRGPALSDVRYEDFAQAAVRRLDELYVEAQEHRIEAKLNAGFCAELIPDLEALVVLHPLRERLHALLMVAQYRCDRQGDALATGVRAQRVLSSALDVESSHVLRHIERMILAHDPALHGSIFSHQRHSPPAVLSVSILGSSPPMRLPLAPLVGRATMTRTVEDALRNDRLVTLHGPGGVGKTHLALRVVGGDRTRGLGEVVWIDLAAGAPSDDVRRMIAAALAVEPTLGAVARRLSMEPSILALDTCEHAVPGVRRLIEEMLSRCSDLRVLVTSRMRIGIPGERVLDIGPLDLPDATVLFRQVAHRLGARAAAADDERLLQEICAGVGNLPLGIELAAHQLEVLSLEELVNAVTHRVLDLQAERSGPGRHHSLRASVEWSLATVAEPVRSLFACCAALPSPFTRRQLVGLDGSGVETVASQGLAVLVNASLVMRSAGDPARFCLLAPMQAMGKEMAPGAIA